MYQLAYLVVHSYKLSLAEWSKNFIIIDECSNNSATVNKMDEWIC